MIAALCTVRAFDEQGMSPAIDAEKIFMHECKDCHGEDGRGRMHGQPDFTNPRWQSNVTDELMFKTIKYGREPMPFYIGALSDDEITALVKYIRSLAKESRSPITASPGQPATVSRAAPESNRCQSCHQRTGDKTAALFATSVHAKSAVGCSACHHGDESASTKEKAHAGQFGFIGKPSAVEQLTICGACHEQPLTEFKTGLHYPKNLNLPRMACSDCHGAHTVGSPRRDVSFAAYCTNCHGLEYLPELPAEFRKLLEVADEETRWLARLRAWGGKPSNELIARRRATRRLIGELVHKTDLRRAVERAPDINRLHETFKKTFGTQTK